MIRGTTPTLRFTFSTIDPADIVVIYLTIKQSDTVILEKTIEDAVTGTDYIEWNLTQEDTLKLKTSSNVNVQIRYRTSDDNAYASRVFTVSSEAILKDGEI